ncbi:MAG: hypothetical protein WCP68_00670 [Enhydrobacter sp.]
MSNAVAIVLAAVIIGGSIVYAQFVDRYQISATQGGNDAPVAWRIEAHSGALVACYPQKQADGKFKAVCE